MAMGRKVQQFSTQRLLVLVQGVAIARTLQMDLARHVGEETWHLIVSFDSLDRSMHQGKPLQLRAGGPETAKVRAHSKGLEVIALWLSVPPGVLSLRDMAWHPVEVK